MTYVRSQIFSFVWVITFSPMFHFCLEQIQQWLTQFEFCIIHHTCNCVICSTSFFLFWKCSICIHFTDLIYYYLCTFSHILVSRNYHNLLAAAPYFLVKNFSACSHNLWFTLLFVIHLIVWYALQVSFFSGSVSIYTFTLPDFVLYTFSHVLVRTSVIFSPLLFHICLTKNFNGCSHNFQLTLSVICNAFNY